jgi:hypothetical protein
MTPLVGAGLSLGVIGKRLSPPTARETGAADQFQTAIAAVGALLDSRIGSIGARHTPPTDLKLPRNADRRVQ